MSLGTPEAFGEGPALGIRFRFGVAIVCCVFAAMVWRAFYLATGQGAWETLVDFHAFYISGKLFHDGQINDAYQFATMLEAQHAFAGSTSFMPWTYPPPFNLVVALLAMLPFVPAYIFFVGATYGAYALVVHRLSPGAFPLAMWVGFPASVVMVICGQNGFLTAAIVGLFCILYLRSSFWAGAALGLMIIKPHLAIGIGLWLLFRMEFRTLALAGGVACALCAGATLLMGPAVWTAFLGATAEAGEFLKEGFYPLYRMTSAYAGMRSAGAQSELAMAVQLGFAISAVYFIFLAARNVEDRRTGLGIATAGSFFISPYLYDYDLPMLAVSFTLLWPSLSRAGKDPTMITLVALAWVAGACGFLSFLPFWLVEDMNIPPIAQGWAPMLAMAAIIISRLNLTPPTAGNLKLAEA